jgi:hypothetical protein
MEPDSPSSRKVPHFAAASGRARLTLSSHANMNRQIINEGPLKGGELVWVDHCGFLKRAAGEFIPWVSETLFVKEGFKKELAETFQFQLATDQVFGGDEFTDAVWTGTTILLESGAYIPTPNRWIPKAGGFFLIKDTATSNEIMIASHLAKTKKPWWRFWT